MKSRLNPWWRYYSAKVILFWVSSFLAHSCVVEYVTNIKNRELAAVLLISCGVVYTAQQVKKIFIGS